MTSRRKPRCMCWSFPKAPIARRMNADFTLNASDAEVAGFFRAVGLVARQLGLEAPGYRAVANIGQHGGQEVPHFHIHLLAGQALSGRMAVPRSE